MFGGRYVRLDGAMEPAAKSVMIESPTGSGKTVMGLLTCKVLQEEYPGLVIGWVAMRRNLLAQAAAENVNKDINVQDIHYVSMFDDHPDGLVKAKEEGRPILMVIDEAQHDAASSMAHLHNLILPQQIIGLTATPFRTDRMKLCFEKVIKDAGIHTLIQDGYLSKFDHYTIPDWNVQTVADHYCADPERWGKSIFYFVNLEECFQLHNELQSRGVVSDVVTGSSDREEQLERFRRGEIPCLINCMVLTEGFDEPSIKTAWVRDSGKGCTMQMGGRAFRLHKDLPVKNVVQSKNTRWPFMKTAMPVMQYIWQNEKWESLQVNPRLNEINNMARKAIATTIVEMPQFILNKQKKSVHRRVN
jgi:superfamily II DNA or RNA helicase